jgi:hypothetical protein
MRTNLPRKLMIKLGILLTLSIFIYVIGFFPSFILNYYSNGTYPIISAVLRWISAPFPFAIGDIIYVLLIASALFFGAKTIAKSRNKQWRKINRFLIPIQILNIFLILYISFKILWGLNYSRPSITKQLNIGNKKYTVKELVLLGNYFIDQLNALQPHKESKLIYNIDELREQAVIDYQKLAQKNPFFQYNISSVKPGINGWVISKIGIEGYYNPLSGEANVNMKLPAWVLPFVTCHEIAHQLGVAREDEANLVAYLVGINSKDVNFQYAVNYNMLRYILLEIRFKSPEDYLKIKDRIDPSIIADFKAENEFWRKYNGKMSNYMGVAFDKFLKLNNQKRGIKSYQNIVVWLWNIHQKQLTAGN